MNSYNLLIADDEYWIREKFRTVLKWEKYNINFLKPAENGEEVLERLAEENCDILITDINMPFVNGIELIKRVHEAYSDIVIFVISGYDDFKYVKESLTTGAIDYLLKPINKIELISVISQALELISKREADREQALKISSVIKDRELSFLVENEPAVYNDTEESSGHSLILIKIHDMAGYVAANKFDLNSLSYALKEKIREITKDTELLIFNYIYRANEFIALSSLEPDAISRMAKKVLEGLTAETGSPVTIAVSTRGYNMDTLHEAYVESVAALMTREYNNKSETVFFNDSKTNADKDVINKIDAEMESRLRYVYQTGNRQAIRQMIRTDIGLPKAAGEKWRYLEVKQAVKRLCAVLIDCAAKDLSPKEQEELEAEAELIDKEIEKLDIAHVCEALDEFIDAAFATAEKEDAGTTRDIVRKAVEYIDNNYAEEISLHTLAQRFNVESSYFSRIFKQETGSNLMQYIAKLRMNNAVNHMKDESINLTEIAFMVGYDDYTYFNRVFKKINGISPSEYRQELLSKKCN